MCVYTLYIQLVVWYQPIHSYGLINNFVFVFSHDRTVLLRTAAPTHASSKSGVLLWCSAKRCSWQFHILLRGTSWQTRWEADCAVLSWNCLNDWAAESDTFALNEWELKPASPASCYMPILPLNQGRGALWPQPPETMTDLFFFYLCQFFCPA